MDNKMDNNSEEQQLQILKNIETLQNTEKELYSELENKATNSEAIINRINQLSQVRISLFKSLNNTYKSLQKNVNNSRTELVELLTVVSIVEEELNNAKAQLNQLYDIKNGKMRMVEINTYYGKQYKAQTGLMKLIIFVFIILLILVILYKKELIPDNIAKILLGVVFALGAFFIIRRLLDISVRDNMNFDEYDWNFNPEDQPKAVYETDTSKLVGDTKIKDNSHKFFGIDCIGAQCCTDGMKYDSDMRACIKEKAPEKFVTEQFTNHCFKGKPQLGPANNSPSPYGSDDSINYASV
jgi:hypothetical protein